MLSNTVCPVCAQEHPWSLPGMCGACKHWIRRSLKALSDEVNCWECSPSFKEAFIRYCRAAVEYSLEKSRGIDKVKELANDFMLLGGFVENFRRDPERREQWAQDWLEKEAKEKEKEDE